MTTFVLIYLSIGIFIYLYDSYEQKKFSKPIFTMFFLCAFFGAPLLLYLFYKQL